MAKTNSLQVENARLLAENDELRRIRDLLVRALVVATGEQKTVIDEAPLTMATKHIEDVDRLRAENAQLRSDLALRNQTACDRKEIIAKLEAENGRLWKAQQQEPFAAQRLLREESERLRAALQEVCATDGMGNNYKLSRAECEELARRALEQSERKDV